MNVTPIIKRVSLHILSLLECTLQQLTLTHQLIKALFRALVSVLL